MVVNVGTAAVGGVAGQNFAALYNSAGTRVAVTADQTTPWSTTGVKSMAFTVSANLTAGKYWCALLSNAATTDTGFARGTSSATINAGCSAAASRFGVFSSGLTATPTSFAPASITQTGFVSFWAGLR
jgi:hypothetical protein